MQLLLWEPQLLLYMLGFRCSKLTRRYSKLKRLSQIYLIIKKLRSILLPIIIEKIQFIRKRLRKNL